MEKLLDFLDGAGFRADFYQDKSGRSYTELEYWTDCCGEDCIATIEGGTPQEFIRDLGQYIEGFDEEEFERPWIEMSKRERVERGAPEDICMLLDSAKEFYDALSDLYMELVRKYRTR